MVDYNDISCDVAYRIRGCTNYSMFLSKISIRYNESVMK